MRQAGVIAAAALYALEHHVERLAEDHANGQLLAEAVREIDALTLVPDQVDTNIVIFRVDPALGSAAEFCQRLSQAGLLTLPISATTIRMVTHLDVTTQQVRRAGQTIAQVASEAPRELDPDTLPFAY
jgi:threonine aldolase